MPCPVAVLLHPSIQFPDSNLIFSKLSRLPYCITSWRSIPQISSLSLWGFIHREVWLPRNNNPSNDFQSRSYLINFILLSSVNHTKNACIIIFAAVASTRKGRNRFRKENPSTKNCILARTNIIFNTIFIWTMVLYLYYMFYFPNHIGTQIRISPYL